MTNEVFSATLWGLILKKVYSHEGILIPSDVDVAQFALMTIPKIIVDDATIYPMVARIPDSMLNLVKPSNQLLVDYRSSMNPTPNGIFPMVARIPNFIINLVKPTNQLFVDY